MVVPILSCGTVKGGHLPGAKHRIPSSVFVTSPLERISTPIEAETAFLREPIESILGSSFTKARGFSSSVVSNLARRSEQTHLKKIQKKNYAAVAQIIGNTCPCQYAIPY